MKVMDSVMKQFAAHLKTNPITSISKRGKGEREIDTSKVPQIKGATGSTYYYKKDQETNQNARYGDIDVSVSLPAFIDIEDPKQQREEELWVFFRLILARNRI
jgi:hypothetical protein